MKDLGQLFITGVSGTELSEDEKDIIQDMDLGGVIFFSRNYENPTQLARLVNSVQELRNDVPLFISVDQEGGRVIRFKEPFIQLPSPMKMAEKKSGKTIFNAYHVAGQELRSCGINLNFAPCIDILKNEKNQVVGDRAFGDNQQDVEKLMSAAIRGHQTAKVIPCVKHFPGHGRTAEDSHDELPVMKTDLDTLKTEEFLVYKRAIRSKLEFLMVAHLAAEAIDPELPTSLSPNTYKILREDLRYQRIIITDDMQMGAITKNYGVEDAAEKALVAGADILLYRDLEVGYEAFKSIEKKITDRVISPQQVRHKIKRVLSCKENRLRGFKPVNAHSISSRFNSDKAKALLESFS